MTVALPADARRFQGARAGIVSRMVAAAIDFVVAIVIVVAIVAASSVWAFFFSAGSKLQMRWPSQLGLSSLTWASLFVYLGWTWARTGKSLGKRVLGLSVVTTSGARISAWVAIARALLYAVFPIGLLWCAVSATHRSVQDLLVRTAVVYDWRRVRSGPRARRPAA